MVINLSFLQTISKGKYDKKKVLPTQTVLYNLF